MATKLKCEYCRESKKKCEESQDITRCTRCFERNRSPCIRGFTGPRNKAPDAAIAALQDGNRATSNTNFPVSGDSAADQLTSTGQENSWDNQLIGPTAYLNLNEGMNSSGPVWGELNAASQYPALSEVLPGMTGDVRPSTTYPVHLSYTENALYSGGYGQNPPPQSDDRWGLQQLNHPVNQTMSSNAESQQDSQYTDQVAEQSTNGFPNRALSRSMRRRSGKERSRSPGRDQDSQSRYRSKRS